MLQNKAKTVFFFKIYITCYGGHDLCLRRISRSARGLEDLIFINPLRRCSSTCDKLNSSDKQITSLGAE